MQTVPTVQRKALRLFEAVVEVDSPYLSGELTATFSVHGQSRPGTDYDPPEGPEIIIHQVTLHGPDGGSMDVPFGFFSVTAWDNLLSACEETLE